MAKILVTMPDEFLNKGADAVIEVLNNGLQKAMTVYNK